jgi:hypothetical protein
LGIGTHDDIAQRLATGLFIALRPPLRSRRSEVRILCGALKCLRIFAGGVTIVQRLTIEPATPEAGAAKPPFGIVRITVVLIT